MKRRPDDILGSLVRTDSPVIHALILAGLILGGCSAALEPVHTTGSYQRLPRDGMKLIVLANDTALTASVRQWLEDRNLDVVYAATAECVRCDARSLPSDTRNFDDAVLVELSRSSHAPRMTITVLGISRNEAADLWSGSAWNHLAADIGGEEAQRNAVILTCHALSTIWRHRPGGVALNRSIDLCQGPDAR
jgi:hypothetical protein